MDVSRKIDGGLVLRSGLGWEGKGQEHAMPQGLSAVGGKLL